MVGVETQNTKGDLTDLEKARNGSEVFGREFDLQFEIVMRIMTK